MNHKYITPPENCTGCGLCSNVCPKNAISMVWSAAGFIVPEVDTSRCVECGICVKSCITSSSRVGEERWNEAVSYAAWACKREVHSAAASGGVFSAIAEYVLSKGGVVYGVKWQDSTTAEFVEVTTASELKALRGTKYVQAVPGMVYRKVKVSLKLGKLTLFSGTACQIHALRGFLKKDYDNLVCLEIFCHGVPSRCLLQRYVLDNEKRTEQEVRYVNFRDKVNGWEQYSVACHYVNGMVECESVGASDYMKIFVSDMALNQACYSCPYSKFPREGDIITGDFWGVPPEVLPDAVIRDGVSAVIENSAKGGRILQQLLLDESIVLIPQSFHSIFKGQPYTFTRKLPPPKRLREKLLLCLNSKSLSDCRREFADWYYLGPLKINRQWAVYKILKVVIRRAVSLLMMKIRRAGR